MDDNIYSFIRDEEGVKNVDDKLSKQIITVSKKDMIEACSRVSQGIIDSLKDNGAPVEMLISESMTQTLYMISLIKELFDKEGEENGQRSELD